MEREVFRFDDELIEAYRAAHENDACGVERACDAELCPCYLLGRHGKRIDLFQCENGKWGIYVCGSNPVAAHSFHDTLEEAVRANQMLLEQMGPDNGS